VYVPESLWPEVRDRVVAMTESIRMGDVRDFRNFMSAVIDARAFARIEGYIARAKENDEVIVGGETDDSTGYFVSPTVIRTDDPANRILCEEIFGPVVAAYVYPDAKWEEVLHTVDTTSPYALTGAVFSRDRLALKQASVALRNAAGNFYVNDKPTGAVVGQQPFGGARGSGTNDKAGSKLNLVRWVSPRNVKETFSPPVRYEYPFMAEE
jgi:1-pyrroline-5-carboxylate dehydrogenase